VIFLVNIAQKFFNDNGMLWSGVQLGLEREITQHNYLFCFHWHFCVTQGIRYFEINSRAKWFQMFKT
jgi:hypothetical protein